jgi:hypothetical protein
MKFVRILSVSVSLVVIGLALQAQAASEFLAYDCNVQGELAQFTSESFVISRRAFIPGWTLETANRKFHSFRSHDDISDSSYLVVYFADVSLDGVQNLSLAIPKDRQLPEFRSYGAWIGDHHDVFSGDVYCRGI